MMKELNTLYTPAQVAERIDLSQSSIRRYTIALEKAGYSNIKRDPNNHRKYDIHDIQTLEYFKKLVNEKKLSFEQALEETMNDLEYIHSKVNTENLYSVSIENRHSEVERLEEKIDKLMGLIQDLDHKVDLYQKDNERLVALIEKQPLELEMSSHENEESSNDLEDDGPEQTEIYEYIDTEKDKSHREPVTNIDEEVDKEDDTKKSGIFSRLKNWLR